MRMAELLLLFQKVYAWSSIFIDLAKPAKSP
jgi:hypothetical protein